jgi:hypothetical protein
MIIQCMWCRRQGVKFYRDTHQMEPHIRPIDHKPCEEPPMPEPEGGGYVWTISGGLPERNRRKF